MSGGRGLRGAAVAVGVVVLLLFGGVAGFFLIKNAQWVVVRFPGLAPRLEEPFPLLEFEVPLALVMVVAFLLGVLLAMLLVVIPTWLRRGVERRHERRFIRGLEGELVDLRNQPVNHPAPLEDLPAEQPSSSVAPSDTPEDEERALLAAALQPPVPSPSSRRPGP